MTFRVLLVASALLALAAAGCLTQPSTPKSLDALKGVTTLLAGPALWTDPQNFPHPMFNWPTLSSPAVNASYWWTPINASGLPKTITGFDHVGHSDADVKAGAGIAIFGRIAVVPEDAKVAHILDISDPTHPKQLSQFDSGGRGAAIIAYPDGKLYTVLAATGGNVEIVNITDPLNPEPLDPIKPTQGAHKLGVVPGTPIVYNAASRGGGQGSQASPTLGKGVTEIFDLTDPVHPVHVQDFPNGYSCHHIFFWNSPDGAKQRAICAGMEYTQIWDTKDPRHPKVIVSVPVHEGVANGPSLRAGGTAFSHSAGFNTKGTILYVGDESGGGGSKPGCLESTSTPAGSAGTPVGATWFYDITTETNPVLKGYFSASRGANADERTCTTHHGRIVPAPDGRDVLAMSYYNEGVLLVDFTGVGTPAQPMPKLLAQYKDNSDTWETWYDQGYLFTGDLARGMDVLKLK